MEWNRIESNRSQWIMDPTESKQMNIDRLWSMMFEQRNAGGGRHSNLIEMLLNNNNNTYYVRKFQEQQAMDSRSTRGRPNS